MTESLPSVPLEDISHKKLLNVFVKGTPVAVGAAVACGCFYIGVNNPETKQVFAPCAFYTLTGFYCPGCGMTRALHNVVTGHIYRAFQFNAILVLAFPVLIYMYTWWATWAFTGRELPKLTMSRRATQIIIALAVVFVVGRNLPGAVPAFFAKGRL